MVIASPYLIIERFQHLLNNLKITKSIKFITSQIRILKSMSEEQPKPKPQKQPYRPTKFFISSLNTHLGHQLVNRLRNEAQHPQNPNRIIGTLVTDNQKLQEKYNSTPEGVRKVIETDKVQFFHDVLLNSDVIIYDLNTCNLDEAQSAISALKISQYTENKTLICVSNVMTWAKSKPKEKKQGDEEQGDENPPQQPDSQQQGGEPPADEGEQKKTYVRFTEKDFNLRRPHPLYEKIKSIQTLCLAAGTAKPNLRTHVICSGIIYGAGEKLFQPYFMQARLQIPEALSVYGKGKNRIPMIHLYDLITYIEKTIQKKPKIPYILALDQNPKPTQKKVVQSISKQIGTGRIVHVPVDPSVKNIDILTLNLRMKPCMFFAKLEQEQAAIQVEEGVQIERFKFPWISKLGFQASIKQDKSRQKELESTRYKNIKSLRHEFNTALGLKQQKVFIMGPPGCGKTHFAKKLSQKYYLPHLHVKQVIEDVKALQNEDGENLRNAWTQKKEAEVAAKQEEYEAQKEKWKKLPKQLRQPLPPFDPEKVDVRLPDELIYKCFKWRLSQNDCLNRGYILDGYPKKYQDAKELFMDFPDLPEGQQPDENTKKVLKQSLAPTKFILLDQSDQDILQNLQRLPEQQITGTHFTQKEAKRRLKQYRALMNSQTGDEVLADFFSEHKIETHLINVTSQTEALLESIVKPISISEDKQNSLVTEIIKKEQQRKQKLRAEMTRTQDIVRNIQSEDYRMKKENEQNQERQILDKKSLALRKYLDVNLVPILSEGIFQILKQFPKDPVDRLAQFLFKNSLKVPNPDPSTFEF